MNTLFLRTHFVLLSAVTASSVYAAKDIIYQNDFEARNDISFRACYKPWISDLKRAERGGYIKVNRADITGQNEGKSHSGVRSFVLDMTIDKSGSRWGGRCIWSGPKMNIPLNRDIFLSGYILPEKMPPDLEIGMGVIFNAIAKKDGKPVKGGALIIEPKGTDSEDWLAFQQNLKELLDKNYRDAVILGYQIVVYSRKKPFHGQRVKLYVDDVTLSLKPAAMELAKNGKIHRNDILKGGPYTVKYMSMFREYPANAVNVIDNSSFELGLKSWYPAVYADPKLIAAGNGVLPTENTFSIASNGVFHGSRCLKISRAKGVSSQARLYSVPIKIEDGRPYSISFYAKSSAPTDIKAAGRKFRLSEQWRRFSFTVPKIKCYTRWNGKSFPGRYILSFINDGTATIWLDAIQMQQGKTGKYKMPESVEIGLSPESEFGTFFPGQHPAFRVDLYNGFKEHKAITLNYQIKDFTDNLIAEKSIKIKLQPGKPESFKIKLDASGKYRHFRIFARIICPGQVEKNAYTTAAIIPDLRNLKQNDFFGSLVAQYNSANFRQSLELNRNAGMKLMPVYNTAYIERAPLDWRKHNPQWNKLRFVVDQLNAFGFTTMVTIYRPVPKFVKKNKNGDGIVGPAEEKEVYDYCVEAARRFKGKVKYWEVFAEYMKGELKQKAQNVRKLLPAAYRGLKQSDPDCVVVACGEDAARDRAMLKQVEEHFKLGSLQYMDAVSLHPYTIPGTPESESLHLQFDELRTMMKKYNHGKVLPVWGTESGYQGADTLHYDAIDAESLYYPRFVTELLQAAYVVRSNLICKGENLARNCSFFLDSGGNGSYSFVRRENGIAPKTVYSAFCQLTHRLSGGIPLGRINHEKDKLLGYFFKQNGKIFATLWIYDPANLPVRGSISLPKEKLEAVNMVGEEITLTGRSQTRLALGPNPIYLYGKGISEKEFIDAVKQIVLEKLTAKLEMKDATTLVAKLNNRGTTPASGRLFFRLPVNLTAPPTRSTVDFILAPWQDRQYELKLKSLPVAFGTEPVKLEVKSDKGTVDADFLPLFCIKAKAAPVIDGNLQEFAKIPELKLAKQQRVSLYHKALWKGNDDLSASVKTMWDKDNFYLAVKVKDSIYNAPFNKQNIWANDALQVSWDTGADAPYIETAISLTADGPRVDLYHGRIDTKLMKASIVKTGDGIKYEIAIPWRAFGCDVQTLLKNPPKFNLAVSDNDGDDTISLKQLKGYTQSLQISPGIVDSKKTDKFGQLILLQ